jgi:hypothetical protein
MMRGTLALIMVSVACSEGRSANTGGDDAVARKLVGVWDATMSVERPYPLQLRSSEVRAICGTIGVVENRQKNASGEEVGSATQIGVYDLPLTQIGLEWNGIPAFPTVAVSTANARSFTAHKSTSDSVQVVLNPGSEERIVLSGLYGERGLQGTWIAQSARGTATGSFSMRPHVNSLLRSGEC